MLVQQHSKKREYEAFSHWNLSLDKECPKVTSWKVTYKLVYLYHEVCEQGKLVLLIKKSGSIK